MLWKRLPFSMASISFLRTRPLKSISSMKLLFVQYFSDTIQEFNRSTKPEILSPEGPRGVLVNPQVVQSVLACGHSDLVTLSFFLWCARQRDYFHNSYAFAHMVNVVTRLFERFRSVDGIVKELEKIGCVTRPQTFLHLIRVFWQGGQYPLIFDTFEAMGRYGYTPNTFACNVLVDILFKSGVTDVALRVLRENNAPNFLSFNIALCNLCKLDDLENIRSVAQNMLSAGYYPNFETFVMILNCCSKKGRLAEAYQVIGMMVILGFQLSPAVWNIIIDGFCRLGRPDMAYCMLEKMIDVGCSPNIMTYTILVKGFMEHKMLEDAQGILRVMESRGCEADLVLSNVLINCYSKMQMHDEALAVFYDMRIKKLEPDAYTFSSLVSSLCKSGRFDLVPKLLGCFNCPIDLVGFNCLLSYFCKAGFPISAVEFFQDLVARGFTLDKYSYTGLLTGLCRSGKTDLAVNVYRGLIIEGFDLDAHIHTLIMSELIRAQKYQSAHDVFREAVLKQYHLDSVSYGIAVKLLARSGQITKAFSLFNEMKALSFTPAAHIFNILLSGFCKEKDIGIIKQLLIEMLDLKIQLEYETCMKLFNFMLKSGHFHLVLNLLIAMLDSGLLPEGVIQKLLREAVYYGIEVDDKYYQMLKESSGDRSYAETSGSEDLIEAAA